MGYKRSLMKIEKSILRQGNVELLHDMKKLKQLLAKMEKKHGVSSDKILRLFRGEVVIPVTAFTPKLTPLEASVKYLKENLGYTLREIGSMLARNERNIWHAYNNSKKKLPGKLKAKETYYFVPVSIFANREISAFEALATYLRDFYKLSYHEIALLLQRDDRTIWTVCHRASIKTT